MIAAPDGILNKYDNHKPEIEKIIPNIMAKNIIFLKL
jgi:hypothetical protein